jgi:hypothetical protein
MSICVRKCIFTSGCHHKIIGLSKTIWKWRSSSLLLRCDGFSRLTLYLRGHSRCACGIETLFWDRSDGAHTLLTFWCLSVSESSSSSFWKTFLFKVCLIMVLLRHFSLLGKDIQRFRPNRQAGGSAQADPAVHDGSRELCEQWASHWTTLQQTFEEDLVSVSGPTRRWYSNCHDDLIGDPQ